MPAFASHDIRCSQNFLHDPRLAAALVAKAGMTRADRVVEIGPGRGILTKPLAQSCGEVLAVEKDPRLYDFLRQALAGRANVRLYLADFLHFALPDGPYKVFANIPFNSTAAILNRLLAARVPPEDAWLAVQKEAADVLLGAPNETLRTILVKPWFTPEVVHRFRRSDFAPAPGVDVVLLRLQKRARPLVAPGDQASFRDLAVYVFTTWRPSLGKILKELFTWRQVQRLRKDLAIDLDGTPTSLSLEQWLGLHACFEQEAGPQARRRVWGSEKRLARQQAKLQKVHRTRKA